MSALATHYQPSKGPPKAIAELPYPYLVNACEKLQRDHPERTAEICAMRARIDAEADAEISARASRDPEESASHDPNPRIHLGANNPPTEAPPAEPLDVDAQFGALQAHFDDLYLESKNWADGQAIENDAQAKVVDRLIDEWKAAIAAAEKIRDEQIDPLNKAIKAVRERFYPLIGETKQVTGIAVRAKAALLAIKTAWGNKERARLQAEADRLAKDAIDKAREAAQAARDAQGDLEATESAEDLIRDAKATLRTATAAAKATPGKGFRTEWVTEITDDITAIRTMWKLYPERFTELALELARQEVRGGKRTIAGFRIHDEKVAV